MSSTVVASRNTQPNTTVLARLAERWRGAGVFLACMDRDGNLLWHDSQMPRVLSLCFTADSGIAAQVRKLPDSAGAHVPIVAPLPGFRIELAPVAKRRKLSAWVAMVARTDPVPAKSERDCAEAGAKGVDGCGTLTTQARKVPLVAAGMFASLVTLVEQMHEDLRGRRRRRTNCRA